ncbi:type II toxin-antitoxin system RelE/ParE family toxin [Candidatus Parcubacteria bacterium]|nr:type II toxin-antitoxin system RelE/ParE family toxin [Candidatus Parcubacteria bacterium]
MDKISKLINKISKKDALNIADTLQKIIENKTNKLDIRKLRGHDYIFRVRFGNYRIIYTDNKKQIKILEISKRDEQTYKNF